MSAPRRDRHAASGAGVAISSVRIGRLVLDGVEPQRRDAVIASFEAELRRLLADYPDRLPAHPGQAAGDPGSAAEIGRQAAAAVHARVVAAC